MVTETSMEAHSQLKPSRMQECYRIIVKAISASGPMNNMMIHKYTQIPLNVVCPRALELRQKGHLEFDRRDICPYTKNPSNFWRIRQ